MSREQDQYQHEHVVTRGDTDCRGEHKTEVTAQVKKVEKSQVQVALRKMVVTEV